MVSWAHCKELFLVGNSEWNRLRSKLKDKAKAQKFSIPTQKRTVFKHPQYSTITCLLLPLCTSLLCNYSSVVVR